jgi:hypothetical protein
MARYDKFQPLVSGPRAAMAADFGSVGNANDNTKLNRPWGCGLDVNGRLVLGEGVSGVIGVIVLTKHKYAGDIVDIMDLGEIVEFDPVTAGTLGAAATKWYAANASGAITTTNTGTLIGYTIEAGRLRVRASVPATIT